MVSPRQGKARPYRDFYTPALHRKFTRASATALVLCYLEACWMAKWDPVWLWFPIGPTGVRTAMLFIASMAVFILRVAQTHVGKRTSTSPFETFRTEALKFGTIQVFLWYCLSAWLFGEVYIWSSATGAKLGWVDQGRSHERSRFNERSVFFRTMIFCLAIAHSFIHLYRDADAVRYPLRKITPGSDVSPIEPAKSQLKKAAQPVLLDTLKHSVAVAFFGPLVWYLTPLRSFATRWTFSFTRFIFFLPKNTRTTGLAPLADILGRLFIESGLLVLLWQTTNEAYTAYISQEPLKKGQPLTNDSKDPNGSLIKGLKSKNAFEKATAFWELVLITHRYPDRRKTMYTELDRSGGSTWSQLLSLCLGELGSMTARLAPSSPPAPVTPTQPAPAALSKAPSHPLLNAPILAPSAAPSTPGAKAAHLLSNVARAHGSSPGAPSPPTQLLNYASSQLLTESQRIAIHPATLKAQSDSLIDRLAASPAARFVRPRPAAQVLQAVCGAPYSTASVLVDAVDALTGLAMASLAEDEVGCVQRDLGRIIREMNGAAAAVEGFLAGKGVRLEDEGVEDVRAVVEALKGGLQTILAAFGKYVDAIEGLSRADVREARRLVQSLERKGRGVDVDVEMKEAN
ncbi:hypothetical protein EJ06DRAFT_512207 [Trichodelitschia bisporula]|uniref:Nuclear envelope protein n=1 Tax=Trichodelitschia bisporula TaxID=703511 RepID=A0A6G1HSU6_9PEZI|nr:hypothetical protein EJ06DRAFT_512207 [Trichodelitschia bisporula]